MTAQQGAVIEYFVPDEQLATFHAQSVERRLRWLDEMRDFLLLSVRQETRDFWVEQRKQASGGSTKVFFPPVSCAPGPPPNVIRRRIEFLLAEARSDRPVRDQAITYTMRVLSNHATIGKDAGSDEIKLKNPRMSWRACMLRSSTTEEDWLKQVTNEHPEPLGVVWAWLKANAHALTEADVWERFVLHPMITITKKEDERLREKGFRHRGTPQERYQAAGIEPVLWQPTPP